MADADPHTPDNTEPLQPEADQVPPSALPSPEPEGAAAPETADSTEPPPSEVSQASSAEPPAPAEPEEAATPEAADSTEPPPSEAAQASPSEPSVSAESEEAAAPETTDSTEPPPSEAAQASSAEAVRTSASDEASAQSADTSVESAGSKVSRLRKAAEAAKKAAASKAAQKIKGQAAKAASATAAAAKGMAASTTDWGGEQQKQAEAEAKAQEESAFELPPAPPNPFPERVKGTQPPCCPYCGAPAPEEGEPCPSCKVVDSDRQRIDTEMRLGAWMVRAPALLHRPGVSADLLASHIRAGYIRPETPIRGPVTKQLWRRADQIGSIRKLLKNPKDKVLLEAFVTQEPDILGSRYPDRQSRVEALKKDPDPLPKDVRVCPSCGCDVEPDHQECPGCHFLLSKPEAYASLHLMMGPWWVRLPGKPWTPGLSPETLKGLIKQGVLKPETPVRGPETGQMWRPAGDVKVFAELLKDPAQDMPVPADYYAKLGLRLPTHQTRRQMRDAVKKRDAWEAKVARIHAAKLNRIKQEKRAQKAQDAAAKRLLQNTLIFGGIGVLAVTGLVVALMMGGGSDSEETQSPIVRKPERDPQRGTGTAPRATETPGHSTTKPSPQSTQGSSTDVAGDAAADARLKALVSRIDAIKRGLRDSDAPKSMVANLTDGPRSVVGEVKKLLNPKGERFNPVGAQAQMDEMEKAIEQGEMQLLDWRATAPQRDAMRAARKRVMDARQAPVISVRLRHRP